MSDLSFFPVGDHAQQNNLSSVRTLAPTGAAVGATKLLIQAQTQNVRYTLDGTDPTTSFGFQLKAGDPPVMIPLGEGSLGTVIKVKQETATAVIDFQWGV